MLANDRLFLAPGGDHAIERLRHCRARRLLAGEYFKRVHRLIDRQFASGHHLGALFPRREQQRRP